MLLRKIEQALITGDKDEAQPKPNKTRLAFEYFLYSLMVAVLGYIDYATGVEIVIFAFYLIPIRLAAVRLGLVGGILISIWATFAWSVSDYFAGLTYSNQLVIVWNVLVRLMSFLVVAWLSARNVALFAEERAASARLRKALSEIKLMEGLLPICASCKKIRDERGQWNVLEHYIQQHSTATFTHGLCPECAQQWAKEAGIEDEP